MVATYQLPDVQNGHNLGVFVFVLVFVIVSLSILSGNPVMVSYQLSAVQNGLNLGVCSISDGGCCPIIGQLVTHNTQWRKA